MAMRVGKSPRGKRENMEASLGKIPVQSLFEKRKAGVHPLRDGKAATSIQRLPVALSTVAWLSPGIFESGAG